MKQTAREIAHKLATLPAGPERTKLKMVGYSLMYGAPDRMLDQMGGYAIDGVRFNILRPTTHSRSFMERWFSLPWRPFQRVKHIPSIVRDGEAFIAGGMVHCTEATWRAIINEAMILRTFSPEDLGVS